MGGRVQTKNQKQKGWVGRAEKLKSEKCLKWLTEIKS